MLPEARARSHETCRRHRGALREATPKLRIRRWCVPDARRSAELQFGRDADTQVRVAYAFDKAVNTQLPTVPCTHPSAQASSAQEKLVREKAVDVQRLEEPCHLRWGEDRPNPPRTASSEHCGAEVALVTVEQKNGLTVGSVRRQCVPKPLNDGGAERRGVPRAPQPQENNVGRQA